MQLFILWFSHINLRCWSDSFQQQPVLLNDLVTSIQAQAGQTDIFVIIRADEQVNHGRVVEVMDHLRQIPRLKLAIATKSPE